MANEIEAGRPLPDNPLDFASKALDLVTKDVECGNSLPKSEFFFLIDVILKYFKLNLSMLHDVGALVSNLLIVANRVNVDDNYSVFWLSRLLHWLCDKQIIPRLGKQRVGIAMFASTQLVTSSVPPYHTRDLDTLIIKDLDSVGEEDKYASARCAQLLQLCGLVLEKATTCQSLLPPWFEEHADADVDADDEDAATPDTDEAGDREIEGVFVEAVFNHFKDLLSKGYEVWGSAVLWPLSRLLYNHPKRADVVAPFVDHLLDVLEFGAPRDPAVVILSAQCVYNATYRCGAAQDLFGRKALNTLKTALARATRPKEAIVLLQASLHVAYDILPYPVDKTDLEDLLRPVIGISGKLKDSNKIVSYLTKVGEIATYFMYKAIVDEKWAQTITTLAKNVSEPLAVIGRRRTREFGDGGPGLGRMVHNAHGNALAAGFFYAASKTRECLDTWIMTFWLDETLPKDVTGKLPPTDVDCCSRAGMSSGRIQALVSDDVEYIHQVGLLFYLVQTFSSHLAPGVTTQGLADLGVFTAAFQQQIRKQMGGGHVKNADVVNEWLFNHISDALNMGRDEAQNAYSSQAATQSLGNRRVCFPRNGGAVVIVSIRSSTKQNAGKTFTVLAEEALKNAGIKRPRNGHKRWYHGGVGGAHVCDVLDTDLTCAVDARQNQDLGSSTAYFYETFERAATHAQMRASSQANTTHSFPADAPAVLIFELVERVMESCPYGSRVTDPNIFRGMVVASRNRKADPKKQNRHDQDAVMKYTLDAFGAPVPSAGAQLNPSVIIARANAVRAIVDKSDWLFTWMCKGDRRELSKMTTHIDEQPADAEHSMDSDELELNLPFAKRWGNKLDPPNVGESPLLGQEVDSDIAAAERVKSTSTAVGQLALPQPPDPSDQHCFFSLFDKSLIAVVFFDCTQ